MRWIQGQPELHNETLSRKTKTTGVSLGYAGTSCKLYTQEVGGVEPWIEGNLGRVLRPRQNETDRGPRSHRSVELETQFNFRPMDERSQGTLAFFSLPNTSLPAARQFSLGGCGGGGGGSVLKALTSLFRFLCSLLHYLCGRWPQARGFGFSEPACCSNPN